MHELIAEAVAVARGMWRRRWVGVLVAWLAAVIGIVALTRMPDRFEATARVYVDTKTVLRPLMRDLAVEPDIDQTVGLLARTLINRPNVELLMKKVDLDAQAGSRQERDAIVERLTREIKVTSAGRDNVFSFSYRDIEAVRARQMVENLVALFLESDQSAKRRDVESARGFIDEQIKAHEVRLADAENRLKEFKLRNLGITDASGRDYFTRVAGLTEEINNLTIELRANEQSREALKREMEGETAILLPEEPAPFIATARSPEIESRLDAQRKQLDELLRRYTDLHPDVIATRKLIARLEEEKQQFDAEARRQAVARAKAEPARTVSNPVMQRVKFALAEAEASVASQRVRLGDLRARLAQMRASANRVPQIEAELAQLNRDYDIVRRNYEALVARREKASMSEEVDATRLAQFRVIEPPRTSPQAVFPNRLVLAPLVMLAALAVGVAASFLVSQLMPTFDNARELAKVAQRPILGSVSMLKTASVIRRRRWKNAAFVSTCGGFVLLGSAWVGWLSTLSRG